MLTCPQVTINLNRNAIKYLHETCVSPQGQVCTALSKSLCEVQCLPVGYQTATYHLCNCIADASASDFRTVQTQAAAAGCRADVLDLTPGTQYRFQVYAVNSQGASPASSIGQSHSIAVS